MDQEISVRYNKNIVIYFVQVSNSCALRDFCFMISGGKTPDVGSRTYTEIMKEQLLKGEESEVNTAIFHFTKKLISFCIHLNNFPSHTQLRKKIAEKSKDGTLKTNGEAKPAPKKRGRWDQTDDTPTPKKAAVSSASATPTSWDTADVSI